MPGSRIKKRGSLSGPLFCALHKGFKQFRIGQFVRFYYLFRSKAPLSYVWVRYFFGSLFIDIAKQINDFLHSFINIRRVYILMVQLIEFRENCLQSPQILSPGPDTSAESYPRRARS